MRGIRVVSAFNLAVEALRRRVFPNWTSCPMKYMDLIEVTVGIDLERATVEL